MQLIIKKFTEYESKVVHGGLDCRKMCSENYWNSLKSKYYKRFIEKSSPRWTTFI